MMKSLHAHTFLAGLILISPHSIAAPRDEVVSTLADQKAVAVTIYNNNMALIKDSRQVGLGRDVNKLAWRGVAVQMRPETAQLRNPASPTGFNLLEQNFDFDLLSPEKLLEKYVGKEVIVIRTHPTTGAETRESAIILATNGGLILKFADRIETGVPGRLGFPGVPENLRESPTLIISLTNLTAGVQNLELTYLTQGLSWRADYVAELNARDDSLDLNGWVTLTNQSGATYPDAKLQLVAGDVNIVRPPRQQREEMMMMSAKVADAAPMQQESLFEYHLYTLQRPTTLAENQTKQVALMSATGIPAKKEFVLEGASHYYAEPSSDIGQKIKVSVFVEFQNNGAGLAIPLPKGIIRVYKKDAQGNAQFVGENQIDHTPKNETIRMKLGEAFDITADKKQTDFQKLAGGGRFNTVYESAYQVVVKNAKTEAVTVIVREPMPSDWTLVSASQPHTKTASDTAEWAVKVPAEGQTTLTYRVRVKY